MPDKYEDMCDKALAGEQQDNRESNIKERIKELTEQRPFNPVKTMNSKEKLAQALTEYRDSLVKKLNNKEDVNITVGQMEGLNKLIENARNGDYSDYDSKKHDLPQNAFVREWDALGIPSTSDSIKLRMIEGEFDATQEESEAWYEREGKKIIEESGLPKELFEKNPSEKEVKEAKEGIKGWDI